MNTDLIYAIGKLLLALVALGSLIWATFSAQTYKTTQLGRLMLPGKIEDGETEFRIVGRSGKLLAIILIREDKLIFAEISRLTVYEKVVSLEAVIANIDNEQYRNKKVAVDYVRSLCGKIRADLHTVSYFEEKYNVKLQA